MQWLHAWRLEFSALSRSAKFVRVVKYLALIATLLTAVEDVGRIWNPLQSLLAAPSGSALGAFAVANGRLVFFLLLTATSAMADIRLSTSILDQIQAHDFYDVHDFRDIAANLHRAEQSVGARVDRFDQHAGWTHPAVNRQLLLRADSGRALNYSVLDEPWFAYEPGDHTSQSRSRLLLRYVVARAVANGQHVFNGRKVRMCNDLGDALVRGLQIQSTDYLSSMMTDGVAFTDIASFGDGASYSDGWSYFLQATGKSFRLRSLADTRASNQLGASTLAFTSDGFLMLVYQTPRNAHSGGKIAPSGSGSFDWSDIAEANSKDFLDVVRYAAARELVEESGLEGHHEITTSIVAREYILPYAFARIVRRAGKPEFFCLGYLPLTINQLRRYKPKRREMIYTVKSFASEIACFDASRDPRQELERICTHYSATDRLFSAQEIRQRYGLSYQVMHGLALLREALEDPASAEVILSFVRRHFAIPTATVSPRSDSSVDARSSAHVSQSP